MRRFMLVGFALLAAAVGALVGVRGRPGTEPAGHPGPPAPRVAPPGVDPAPGADAFVGVLFARQQVDLASVAQAVVETVPVQLGARVARGDVIATLDADALRRELAAASAAVRAANADLASVRVELAGAADRVRRFAKYPEGVPGDEIAEARTRERLLSSQVTGARARVGGAMARVEQLRVLLESAAVVAPFDGVIAARYVDPGALVGPGVPIARLISADDLWVRFAVAEEQAGAVQLRSCIRVVLRSPALSVSGTVEMVAPQVDTALRMLVAEARLSVPAAWRGKLQAGLAAEVTPVACGPS